MDSELKCLHTDVFLQQVRFAKQRRQHNEIAVAVVVVAAAHTGTRNASHSHTPITHSPVEPLRPTLTENICLHLALLEAPLCYHNPCLGPEKDYTYLLALNTILETSSHQCFRRLEK